MPKTPSTKSKDTLSLEEKISIIKNHPAFSKLSPSDVKKIAQLATERTIASHKDIVVEGEVVDSIYFIVKGKAEVIQYNIPIALLRAGETIGLNDAGLYSTTGRRTATVTALSKMILLQINIKDFHELGKSSPLNKFMLEQAELLQRMNLIKQAAPFAKINMEDLHSLAEQMQEVTFPADKTIFKQGSKGDKCYLILSGEVEIFTQRDKKEIKVAVLKENTVFGETSLLLDAQRNASARTLTACKLLTLNQESLKEVMAKTREVGSALLVLTKARIRPLRYDYIQSYTYKNKDGQEMITLKDPVNYNYFRLTDDGLYLWKRMDGTRTIRDLAKDYAKKYIIYDPNMISEFVYDLMDEKFIVPEVPITDEEEKPLWKKFILKLRSLMEASYAFPNADQWVTRNYNNWARILYTKAAQALFLCIGIIGLFAFIYSFHFNIQNMRTLPSVVIILIFATSISMAATVFHELSHAFTTKFFGRDVKNFGVGWFWLGPMAFCDTSDMWLNPIRHRMCVDLAGLYFDCVIAGLAAIIALFVTSPAISLVLCLFSLGCYLGILGNLNPMIELDGYYALNDWSGREDLRLDAVLWLTQHYKKIWRRPSLLFSKKIEVMYWWICIAFIVLKVTVFFLVSKYLLFGLIGVRNPYVSILLLMTVFVFSILSILAEVRKVKTHDKNFLLWE